MTKKFKLTTDVVGNCFINSPGIRFGMFDKLEKEQVSSVIDFLNKQDEIINRLEKENYQLKEIINKNQFNKALAQRAYNEMMNNAGDW